MHLDKYLSKHKAYIDDFLFCANYKNIKYIDRKSSFFSKFRKPNPGMILCLAKKYNINLRKSYLIGDNDTDILAGKLANLKTILVESIKTKNYGLSIKPDFNVKNLYQAVNLILRHYHNYFVIHIIYSFCSHLKSRNFILKVFFFE